MITRSKFVPVLLVLLAFAISACGVKSKTKFVAPEIKPPADLIPAYLPDGFKLFQGFQVLAGEAKARLFPDDSRDCPRQTIVQRAVCCLELPDLFFGLKSPASNEILGISYQNGDQLLLITKSYFPGGSLDLWRTNFEKGKKDNTQDCNCNCGCCPCRFFFAGPLPFPFRHGEIQEVRTVGETQVAIVDQGLMGMNAVFVRGDYLLTVESNLPLEEVLKIVESLLQ